MSYKSNGYKSINDFREVREGQKSRYRAKTSNIYNRRRWTDEEETLVIEHKIPDMELSSLIHRSVSAIQVKRNKLKKMMV